MVAHSPRVSKNGPIVQYVDRISMSVGYAKRPAIPERRPDLRRSVTVLPSPPATSGKIQSLAESNTQSGNPVSVTPPVAAAQRAPSMSKSGLDALRMGYAESEKRLHFLRLQNCLLPRRELGLLIPDAEALADHGRKLRGWVQSCLSVMRSNHNSKFSLLNRLANPDAYQHRNQHIKPWEVLSKDIERLSGNAVALRDRLEKQTQDVEIVSNSKGGICAVYNAATGCVDVRDTDNAYLQHIVATGKPLEASAPVPGGIAGVYNPTTQAVEWKTCAGRGIAGCYNEHTRKVEWKRAHGARSSVYGVFNRRTRTVEWREMSLRAISGVWDPVRQCVVWSDPFDNYASVGYFDRATERVIWTMASKKNESLAVIVRDGDQYHTSFAFEPNSC